VETGEKVAVAVGGVTAVAAVVTAVILLRHQAPSTTIGTNPECPELEASTVYAPQGMGVYYVTDQSAHLYSITEDEATCYEQMGYPVVEPSSGDWVEATSACQVESVGAPVCTAGGAALPPAPPTNLSASAITPTGFLLSWAPGSGDVTFTVIITGLPGSISQTGTTFQVSGAAPGTAYACRVVGEDAQGTSSAWTGLTVTTATQGAPAPPPTPIAPPAPPPPPVAPFTVSRVTADGATFTWAPVAEQLPDVAGNGYKLVITEGEAACPAAYNAFNAAAVFDAGYSWSASGDTLPWALPPNPPVGYQQVGVLLPGTTYTACLYEERNGDTFGLLGSVTFTTLGAAVAGRLASGQVQRRSLAGVL
jgi:hypothetical protein